MMREYYAYDGHACYEPRARTALLNFVREPTYGRPWLICDQDTPVGYIVLTFGYSLEYLGGDAFHRRVPSRSLPPWPGAGDAPPSTSSKMPPAPRGSRHSSGGRPRKHQSQRGLPVIRIYRSRAQSDVEMDRAVLLQARLRARLKGVFDPRGFWYPLLA
jgi:hypothetical protein